MDNMVLVSEWVGHDKGFAFGKQKLPFVTLKFIYLPLPIGKVFGNFENKQLNKLMFPLSASLH